MIANGKESVSSTPLNK